MLCALCGSFFVLSLAAIKPDIVRSSGGIPAHLAGRFREPVGFQQSPPSAMQFQAAGITSPNSLFFGPRGRLLTTPGLYEFPVQPIPPR